ncbi:hypothetical protein Glove_177g71 [Diversispora epigaea]|uniref:Uncharacterized protein n=1 Tax=Diversispora epigaea TaxID=1348612 RepID=A0A397INL8_9GLOM|nr:hypothetical protein Glove_177g71 [Diversispora epigaea]
METAVGMNHKDSLKMLAAVSVEVKKWTKKRKRDEIEGRCKDDENNNNNNNKGDDDSEDEDNDDGPGGYKRNKMSLDFILQGVCCN